MQKSLKNKFVLKFGKPTNSLSPWEGALPLGNGRVGALVQGGVRYERIMITDAKAIWKGNVGVLPDVSDKMKEVRRNVEIKNQVMAGITIEKAFEAKKYTPSKYCPLPIADLVLEQRIAGKHVSGYFRNLSLDNEEVSVCFSDAGTKVDRSAFVSFDNDYIYYEISKSGNNPLFVDLSLVAHDKQTAVFNGKYFGERLNEKSNVSSNFLEYEFETEEGVFGAIARVATDTKAVMQVVDNVLKIEGAERIVLIIKTYTGKVKEKPHDKAKNELLAIKQISYEKAFKAHANIYAKKWGKSELSIADEKETTIENLIASFGPDSTLIYEKLFHYGKYLLLTGVDDQFYSPFVTGLWSKHYANQNALADSSVMLPALYSAAFSFDQEQKVGGLCSYFIKFSDDLKKNAFRIYKSKGFMVPNFFVGGSGLPASIKAKDISTITAGAIIANIYYDYFLYTKDIKFLRTEALPFMCSVADFYINYFYRNSQGKMVSCPSFSPFGKAKYFENKNVGVYESSYADFAVVRSLLNNIISSANVYSLQVKAIVDYQNFLNALPQIKTEKGAVKEYLTEENSDKSSGFVHLYPVYGVKEITSNGNPAIVAPYLSSVISKIDKGLFAQNITALGRLAQMTSVLGQGDACVNILRYMIAGFLSDNLMFLNADKTNQCAFSEGDNFFNISANQLLCTSIIEALVLDYGNNISILNAKPSAWKHGAISGIVLKQNVIADISWDDKRGNMSITFKALKNTAFNLMLFKGVKKVKNYNIDTANPFIENIKLSSGKTISFEIKY